MKYIASVSFGKDSLAMLLRLIEENKPLDEVVFYDTGMEFQAIYETRDRIKNMLAARGIKFTELKPACPFVYKMFEKPVHHKDGTISKGYSWCGGLCRWGTTEKLAALEKYCKGHCEYVGIAADEHARLSKDRRGNKLFPLSIWGMSEKDCLNYCYARGFFWEEDGIRLYDILQRVSCWCCGNKNLKELRNYYKYLPKYWEKLKAFQRRTNRPFKKNKTVFDLEESFKADN